MPAGRAAGRGRSVGGRAARAGACLPPEGSPCTAGSPESALAPLPGRSLGRPAQPTPPRACHECCPLDRPAGTREPLWPVGGTSAHTRIRIKRDLAYDTDVWNLISISSSWLYSSSPLPALQIPASLLSRCRATPVSICPLISICRR